MTTKQGMIKIVIMPNLEHLIIKRKSKMRIKPTMSHALDKGHLNELLVKWYQEQNKQLMDALAFAKNNWSHHEPSESVMQRYFEELDIN